MANLTAVAVAYLGYQLYDSHILEDVGVAVSNAIQRADDMVHAPVEWYHKLQKARERSKLKNRIDEMKKKYQKPV